MTAYEATITVRAVNELEAKALYNALLVEVSSQPSPLVRMRITLQGAYIILAFTSEKRASIRAALNSFLRLLAALEGAARALNANYDRTCLCSSLRSQCSDSTAPSA